MAAYVPPKKGTAFIFYVNLVDQSNTKLFKANPTLAGGDVKVSIDGAAFNNLTNLPSVTPAAGTAVQVSLTAGEMNGDNIEVVFSDAAGSEWCDLAVNLQTATKQIDDLLSTSAYTTPPTVAAIATAIWQDLLASGDFGTAASIGKLLKDDIDAAISSRYSGTPPTAAAITTAVWQDLLASGDFGTAASVGKLIKDDLNATITSRLATADVPTNFSALSIDANGRAKVQVPVIRNVAYPAFLFLMRNAVTHQPMTGLIDGNFTSKIETIDGAAFAGLGGTVTEVGEGFYMIDLADTELDGSSIGLVFKAAGSDTTALTLYTSA